MQWKTIDRPGYFGGKRDNLQKGFSEKYGASNWRITWQWGLQVIERPEALQIYEDGYYEHFRNNPDVLS